MTGQLVRNRQQLLWVWCALGVSVLAMFLRAELSAENVPSEPVMDAPIELAADYAAEGKTEDGQGVLILRGHCRLQQRTMTATARQMVLWQSLISGRESFAVYLEDDVRVEQIGQSDQQSTAFLSLSTRAGAVDARFRFRSASSQFDQDALYQRALQRRRSVQRAGLTQTQFVLPSPDQRVPGLRMPPTTDKARRIRISPRSATPINIESQKSTNTVPPEQVTILTGGINLVIEGVDQFDVVDLSADRVVLWTESSEMDQFRFDTTQSLESQFQVYLEGNIVARQGISVLRAERAYYDAREDRGLLLDAELSVKPPQLGGHRLRVRAEKMRQNSRHEFHASNAWASTSQFGNPGYRMQASDIFVEPYFVEPLDLPRLGGEFDSSRFDPVTGAPLYRELPWLTSLNNTLFIEDYPLVFLPYVSGPAEDPGIPVRSVTVNSDRLFGQQLRTSWDLLQLLGIDKPAGTSLTLQADYLSRRGPAVGLSADYLTHDLLGIPGMAIGSGLGYYIYDTGSDNLGSDRRDLEPLNHNRGRITWRHRQELPDGFSLLAEIGYFSDRNFLEQFDEREFDTGKDIETLVSLSQTLDNWQWGVLVRPQLFAFENNTEWLPRGDLSILGQPLFGDWLSWSSHSMAGYAQLNLASPPGIAGDLFSPLPYYADVAGGLAMTRHELSLPLNFGAIHLVPYVWGEAAGWSNQFTGDSLDRVVGSAGVRGSIMFTRLMPWVQSRIFNLNGLAHKMVFDVDWSITNSNRDLSVIPQWNEFDDNAQERFRQRLFFNTYGLASNAALSAMFPQLDPRNVAVRSGAGSNVTAPFHELVDDLHVVRLGWRHRWQTKVGPPERLRIKDWMTLDLDVSLFPNAARDNFGETAGLFGARYAWHVGDRTSILANSMYDFFNNGMQLWNVSVLNQRGTRGSVYLGVRQVAAHSSPTFDGFRSQILTFSGSYAMSDKWIATAGTAFDLSEGRNRGQSLTMTRVGADFLIHFGANFDASKNNAGIALSVEPRLGNFNAPSTQLSNLLRVRHD